MTILINRVNTIVVIIKSPRVNQFYPRPIRERFPARASGHFRRRAATFARRTHHVNILSTIAIRRKRNPVHRPSREYVTTRVRQLRRRTTTIRVHRVNMPTIIALNIRHKRDLRTVRRPHRLDSMAHSSQLRRRVKPTQQRTSRCRLPNPRRQSRRRRIIRISGNKPSVRNIEHPIAIHIPERNIAPIGRHRRRIGKTCGRRGAFSRLYAHA